MDWVKKIAELKAILGDEKLLLGVIKDEIKIIADKFGNVFINFCHFCPPCK